MKGIMRLFKIILLYIYLESNNQCRRLFDCLLRTSGSVFSNIWKSKNLQFHFFFETLEIQEPVVLGFFCKISETKNLWFWLFENPSKTWCLLHKITGSFIEGYLTCSYVFGELQYNISELILEFLRTSHM